MPDSSSSSSFASKVLSPLQIGGVTFKNRLAVSPMCQYTSQDGFFNDYHLVHLGSMAMGGAGLVFTEATAVEPEGRISPNDAGLWKDEHIAFLRRITSFLKQHGAVPGIQLAHAGRKASAASPWKGDSHIENRPAPPAPTPDTSDPTVPAYEPAGAGGLPPTLGPMRTLEKDGEGWQTKAPSAVAFDEAQLWKVPHELSEAEIEEISAKFVSAARRAAQAGFRVVELHYAHGYLVHEFLSPHSNKRTDRYGGSLENRMRLALETARRVREVLPEDVLLFARLSVTDWSKDGSGWTVEDSVELSRRLKEEAGVSVIDCSSGFVIPNYREIPFGPGFQVPLAKRIREEAGVKTGAVGFLTSGKQMEAVLQQDDADLIFVGREFLRNPHLPFTVAKELGEQYPERVFPIEYAHWLKSKQ